MLDKLLGKKEKGIQIFNLPDKKYCHDSKKLAKMDKKDLLDVVADMEKYIGLISDKVNSHRCSSSTARNNSKDPNNDAMKSVRNLQC